MTKADILRGRRNGHAIYPTIGSGYGRTPQELEKIIYQDAFKHFNITAEDLEYPELPELPPEEQEKFDLYIKGLWERQEGDNDEKV